MTLHWEYQILDGIQSVMQCSFLDWLVPKITFLGNAGWLWILTAICLLCIKKYRMDGAKMGTALALGSIIGNLILKNLVQRSRPCWVNDTITLLIANPKDYSFPSGHTTASFASAYVLYCMDKRVGIVAYILASLIAFSRLYLYVHFPTDVLAGICIGTVVGAIAVKLVPFVAEKIKKRYARKSA